MSIYETDTENQTIILDDPDLVSPDVGVENPETEIHFTSDEDCQRGLLAAVLKHKTLLTFAAEHVRPTAWTSRVHQTIAKIGYEFFKVTGEVPPKAVIRSELLRQARDEAAKIYYVSELGATLDYAPDVFPLSYLEEELRIFAKRYSLMKAISSALDKKGNIDEAIEKLVESQQSLRQKPQIQWRSMAEISAIAEHQSEDWLIENWLEFGSLAMLTGEPFGGKSCLIAELIAAIKKWSKLGPLSVADCPVLTIDLENKERVTRARLSRALDGDLSCMRDWSWPEIPEDNLPLTPDFLESMISEFKAMCGGRKPLVIIDTFRSAFAASEMDVDEVKKILYPLQRIAKRQEAAILVLHHRPKSGAKYSGQTAIPGALDYLWVWEIDRELRTGTLELFGTRGDLQEPIRFAYQNGRNTWLSAAIEESAGQDRCETLIREALAAGPLSQKELVDYVQDNWDGTDVPGRDRIRTVINGSEGVFLAKVVLERGRHAYSLL